MKLLIKTPILITALSALFFTANAFSNETIERRAEIERKYDKAIKKLATDYSDKRTLVKSYYKEFLKRSPDEQGWNDWVNYIDAHGCSAETLRKVVSGFANSDEFNYQMSMISLIQGRSAYEDELVMRLYRGAFQKNPEKSVFVYYIEQMDDGYGWRKPSIIRHITTSQEFKIKAETEWCS